ncbi:MAG TPA: NnrS family protein [Acidobacteriaceae bacterium]
MLLPGTFLGVWNLISIAHAREPSGLSPAWLQAHGHAQLFGWVGSFIIGIGFYSLTKIQSTLHFPVRAGWWAWALWTTGISLRWCAGVTLWHWRLLLPVSAVLELVAFGLFAHSVRRHQGNQPRSSLETWMRSVIVATFGFAVALIVNCFTSIHSAAYANTPAISHGLDQQYLVLVIWGVIVPMIWGFNARWLPIFAGFQAPDGRALLAAHSFSVVGIVVVFLQWWGIASVCLLIACLLSVHALHIWDRPDHPPKLLHIHRSFVVFVQAAYIWLIASCLLFVFAVTSDRHGGIWGASRHALTVGFVAGMVFVIAPRILPAFCGMRALWSTRLMFWSLLLLHIGCAMRVIAEPLAYENIFVHAWRWLPASAYLELAAVTLFALNLGVTLLLPPAHLRARASAP